MRWDFAPFQHIKHTDQRVMVFFCETKFLGGLEAAGQHDGLLDQRQQGANRGTHIWGYIRTESIPDDDSNCGTCQDTVEGHFTTTPRSSFVNLCGESATLQKQCHYI